MAAMTEDANISAVGPVTTISMPAIADTFYQGSLVFNLTAGGNVTNLPVNSGDNQCVGVCLKQQVIATAGDLLEVAVVGLFWLPGSSNHSAGDAIAIAYMDDSATLTDNPADLENNIQVPLVAQDIVVGRLIRITSTQQLLAINIGGITGGGVLATGAAVLV